ncbi:hypothetical protein B0F90DRAFT_1677735, partial [Multifurca ochricompacta]
MELPHPVFWIEACASMPTLLKDRVLEAFQKLHDRGVVHGDVALRHILIGADARVTLIDFQASRADEPNEVLGLPATFPGEKDLEIRRVKFLLDIDNARKKEFRKSKAARQRSYRNRARARQRRELLQHGITTGLPMDEPEPWEEVKEAPIPLDQLEKYWMEDANDDPRRFVVPGSSDSEVAIAISSFLRCLRDIEEADSDWSISGNGPSSPITAVPKTKRCRQSEDKLTYVEQLPACKRVNLTDSERGRERGEGKGKGKGRQGRGKPGRAEV